MSRIIERVDIKCPVNKVFAYTLDVKSWPKWQVFIREPEQTSQGQIRIGTTFMWITHMMGLSVKSTAKVINFELNKRWSENMVTPRAIIEGHLFFDPIERGTQFTLRCNMMLSGYLKLFSSMFVRSMRKQMKVALKNIKSILEAQI
jgi:hypothetical protein